MWPQALQMTRDECRGVLRRLELESYSHVISVFRAQGGLSDAKAKLLEELRGICHISAERHRSEARRVANDEQLATIAEAISGPNTWQEWSREGRRSFPLLPRVAPQTALALIANNVASEIATENAKLPYPADTGAVVAEEHAAYTVARDAVAAASTAWEKYPRSGAAAAYVVTSDPFKMPDIPAVVKKNLKRNNPDHGGGANKKRSINAPGDGSPTKLLQHHHQNTQQQQHNKQYHHITASSSNFTAGGLVAVNNGANSNNNNNHNSNMRKVYHNNQNQKIQQQYQQLPPGVPTPVKGNKAATGRRSGAAANATAKRALAAAEALGTAAVGGVVATPAKSGRRAQRNVHDQQQQRNKQQQQQQQQQHHHMLLDSPPEMGGHLYAALGNDAVQPPVAIAGSGGLPQIAASKKDITKNLNKLHLQTTSGASMSHGALQCVTTPPVNAALFSGNAPSVGAGKLMLEKQLISTPVQKYIVEDRQPLSPVGSSAHVSSMPQIMTLPPLGGATNTVGGQAPKMRTISGSGSGIINTTTHLPPGTKISHKKPLAMPSTLMEHITGVVGGSNPHMYSLIDGSSGGGANIVGCGDLPPSLVTPLPPGGGQHMHSFPAAVVQLQGVAGEMAHQAAHGGAAQPTQSKVITKLISGGNTVNITKIETINNGATLVTSGGNASTSGCAPTFIKNLSSTMLLSSSAGSSAGGVGGGTGLPTIITSSGAMFRKPTNIVKSANLIGVGAAGGVKISPALSTSLTSSTNSGGPQIISNIKLKPATTTVMTAAAKTFTGLVTSAASSTSSLVTGISSLAAAHPSFLQHATIKSGGLRTSVKICQSPNGKMFIQPATAGGGGVGMEGLKAVGKLSTHKLIMPMQQSSAVIAGSPTTTIMGSVGVGSASGGSGSGGGSGGQAPPHQRIAIQKVQIISAPMSSPNGTNVGGNFSTTLAGLNSMQKANTAVSALSPTMGTASGTAASSGGFQMGGPKGNLIFMPASAMHAASPGGTITLTKGGGGAGSVTVTAKAAKPTLSQSNVVVIAGSSTSGGAGIPAFPTAGGGGGARMQGGVGGPMGAGLGLAEEIEMDSSQMITEDTPVDILNMPILMENCGPADSSVIESSHRDSVNSLATGATKSGKELATTTTTTQQQKQKQRTLVGKHSSQASALLPRVVLDATDWEMELDQARATNKARSRNNDAVDQIGSSGSSDGARSAEESSGLVVDDSATAATAAPGIIILDDSFDDVIVEEHDDETADDDDDGDIDEEEETEGEIDDQIDLATEDDEESDASGRMRGYCSVGGGSISDEGHIEAQDTPIKLAANDGSPFRGASLVEMTAASTPSSKMKNGQLATAETARKGATQFGQQSAAVTAVSTKTTTTNSGKNVVNANADSDEGGNQFSIIDDSSIEYIQEDEDECKTSAIGIDADQGNAFTGVVATAIAPNNNGNNVGDVAEIVDLDHAEAKPTKNDTILGVDEDADVSTSEILSKDQNITIMTKNSTQNHVASNNNTTVNNSKMNTNAQEITSSTLADAAVSTKSSAKLTQQGDS